jgi:hypothetical protein
MRRDVEVILRNDIREGDLKFKLPLGTPCNGPHDTLELGEIDKGVLATNPKASVLLLGGLRAIVQNVGVSKSLLVHPRSCIHHNDLAIRNEDLDLLGTGSQGIIHKLTEAIGKTESLMEHILKKTLMAHSAILV